MSLQFKAYLIKGNPNNVKEIRRFTVDTDVSSNYEYLRNKVSSVFPNISDGFSLQYKDAEGDFISFSSDEELMQALSQINDGLFRLYVKTQKCEGKKDENGENFCKGWRRFAFGGQYPHEQPRHGPPPPPPHGPHPHPHPHPPHWGAWGGFGAPPPAWAPWAGHFQAQAQSQAPGAEGTQASTSSGQTGQDQQQQQQKGPTETATAYLNSVGEAVAGFLKPLGIDVDIDVEHNGQRTKCAESEVKKQQRQEEKTEAQSSGTQQTTPDKTTEKSTEEPAPSSPPNENEWTVVQDGEGSADMEMQAASPRPPLESMSIDPPSSSNPHLAAALKKMYDMGFRDDGGWLSRLLEAHNYSIPQAMEAMQPGNRA